MIFVLGKIEENSLYPSFYLFYNDYLDIMFIISITI